MRNRWIGRIFFGNVLLLCAMERSIYAAETLFIPLPQLTATHGTLQSALELGKNGLDLTGQLASQKSGASFLMAQGNFPFEKSQERRVAGWGWGLRIGTTEYQYENGIIFTPSTYFWEVAVGRGTTEWNIGGESGIRGYFEVGLRDQRPQRGAALETTLRELKAHVEEHATSVALRMGAGHDFAGLGLVAQKAPRISNHLEGTIYLPAGKYDRTYLGFQWESMMACVWDGLGCGLNVNFLQSSNAKALGTALEMYRHFSYGITTFYRWGKRYGLSTTLNWNSFVGCADIERCKSRRSFHSGIPSLQSSLFVGF